MKYYHKNPRQITDKQHADLRRWLSEFGDLGGIVHNLPTDEIIGGNRRGRVFDINECEIVMVMEADEPDAQGTVGIGYVIWRGNRYAYRQVKWDEKTCEKANVIANKAGGAWDFDILANQFELSDLLEWGFDESELQLDWGKDAPDDPGAQVDKADELRQVWGVELGQLWQLGEHRLICGDCTDEKIVARVMGGEKAEICFTSPPYNLGKNIEISNRSKTLKEKGSVYNGTEDSLSEADYLSLLWTFTSVALGVCQYAIVNVQQLAGNKVALIEYLHAMKNHFADVAIWHKTNQQPAMAERVMNSCFEYVFFFSSDKQPTRAIKTAKFRGTFDNVYTSKINTNEYASVHGAAFPVEFADTFIEAFSEKLCYEPFCGTGTTLIACERLNRKCRAVEISPAYCAVTIQRWFDMTGQEPVLLGL